MPVLFLARDGDGAVAHHLFLPAALSSAAVPAHGSRKFGHRTKCGPQHVSTTGKRSDGARASANPLRDLFPNLVLEESDAIHQLLHVHIIGSDHNGADGLFLSAVLGVRSAIATPAP